MKKSLSEVHLFLTLCRPVTDARLEGGISRFRPVVRHGVSFTASAAAGTEGNMPLLQPLSRSLFQPLSRSLFQPLSRSLLLLFIMILPISLRASGAMVNSEGEGTKQKQENTFQAAQATQGTQAAQAAQATSSFSSSSLLPVAGGSEEVSASDPPRGKEFSEFSADVLPNTRYRISFRSAVPTDWQIRFHDAEDELPLGGILNAQGGKYLGGEKKKGENAYYLQEFYTPAFARKALIRIKHKAEDFRFEIAPESEYRNINPEFELGAENFSGYARSFQSCIRKRAEGGNYLEISNSRYAMVMTDPLPVTAGRSYRISLRREDPAEKSGNEAAAKENISVYIRFLDKTGRILGNQRDYWKQVFLFYANWKSDFPASKDFTAPEGAAFLECLITNGKIAGFYITEKRP